MSVWTVRRNGNVDINKTPVSKTGVYLNHSVPLFSTVSD